MTRDEPRTQSSPRRKRLWHSQLAATLSLLIGCSSHPDEQTSLGGPTTSSGDETSSPGAPSPQGSGGSRGQDPEDTGGATSQASPSGGASELDDSATGGGESLSTGGAGQGSGGLGAATSGDMEGSGGTQNEGACPNPLSTFDVSHLEVSESHDRYGVTGSTEQEIRTSINQNRNDAYDAYTSWDLSWSYADCSGNGLSIQLDIGYRLPEWQTPEEAAPEVVDAWSAYTRALDCHEYGHAAFGIQAALEIHETLSLIDAKGDCNMQQAQASEAFHAIIGDYVQQEIEYDEQTNHGATQGAIFPAP